MSACLENNQFLKYLSKKQLFFTNVQANCVEVLGYITQQVDQSDSVDCTEL